MTQARVEWKIRHSEDREQLLDVNAELKAIALGFEANGAEWGSRKNVCQGKFDEAVRQCREWREEFDEVVLEAKDSQNRLDVVMGSVKRLLLDLRSKEKRLSG
jgi:hypothetical protein